MVYTDGWTGHIQSGVFGMRHPLLIVHMSKLLELDLPDLGLHHLIIAVDLLPVSHRIVSLKNCYTLYNCIMKAYYVYLSLPFGNIATISCCNAIFYTKTIMGKH